MGQKVEVEYVQTFWPFADGLYVVCAQYTFLSHIHRGNHNLVEILGICLVIIGSTFPSLKTGDTHL